MNQSRNGGGAGVVADERPLSARSVIASTLLGTRPPRLSPSRLVRAGAVFGIAEGTIRTALSRMATSGELVLEDGRYRLSGRLLERQQRLDEGRAGARLTWDGTWELWVVAAERRPAAERAELRAAAAALHLAEVREGVWGRPANLDPGRLAAERAVLDTQCLRFDGARVADPGALVMRLWDLGSWAQRARALVGALDEATGALASDGSSNQLAGGFVLAAAVLRHLQADAQLPDELVPVDWPGAVLRARFGSWYAAYQELLHVWLRAT